MLPGTKALEMLEVAELRSSDMANYLEESFEMGKIAAIDAGLEHSVILPRHAHALGMRANGACGACGIAAP